MCLKPTVKCMRTSVFLFLAIIILAGCGGGGSEGGTVAAPSDTSAPSIPGSVTADAVSAGKINVSWGASTVNAGVARYRVYRNGAYLTASYLLTYSDDAVAKNTNYCYRVSAVDETGNESGQSAQACATTPDSWTKQWGSPAYDIAHGIVTDGSGNIYVTGQTTGNIDGQVNAGGSDAFLTKCDPAGTRVWTRYIGTAGMDQGRAVAVDSAGNVYVTGWVSGSFAGSTHQGAEDIFLAQYDGEGNLTWYQQWGTAESNHGRGVAVYGSYVYVAGDTYVYLPGEPVIVPGEPWRPRDLPNLFVSKRNAADGSEFWSRLDGTLGQSDYAEGIATDGSGNVYVAGHTTGAFPGYTNNETYDIFVAKYDPQYGQRLWVQQRGSTAHDYAYALAVDGNDNVYVTGSTRGSIDSQTYSGNDDIVLMKFDPGGNWLWTRLFGTSRIDEAYGISIDPGDNVYLTGWTSGALGGGADPGLLAVFLMQCDTAGTPLWTRLLGARSETGYGVSFNTYDSHVYVTGQTMGNLDGNISAGYRDVFLLKYSAGGVKQ